MKGSKAPFISFIIPALNEAANIGAVMESIRKNAAGRHDHEIIVVDNGSTDDTVRIARYHRAIVVQSPGCTISALRNKGVKKSRGEVLVFIDGDVFLRDTWGERFRSTLGLLEGSPETVTGSTYGIRDDHGWIEKHWFGPALGRERVNYINGGHLILRRALFDKIGGFDEALPTGEDYEFCQRGVARGAKIVNDQGLEVVHEGYPKTLRAFFRRERWHGKGDFTGLGGVFKSRPAVLSLSQFLVFLSALGLSAIKLNILYMLVFAAFTVAVCTGSAIHRCRGRISSVPHCAFLYCAYFTARTWSFLDAVSAPLAKKRLGKLFAR